MKYVVFHIQTGGLNPLEHSILEIGAIVEDTNNPLSLDKIPKFQALIKNDVYKGDPMAIYLNRELFKEIINHSKTSSKQLLSLDVLAATMHTWLVRHVDTTIDDTNFMLDFNSLGKNYDAEGAMEYQKHKTLLINVAGKNFGVFLHRFLKRIPEINDYIRFNHRFMDPAILYFDPKIDQVLPGTEECKRRAGIEAPAEKNHDTIIECWDVIMMFRNKINN